MAAMAAEAEGETTEAASMSQRLADTQQTGNLLTDLLASDGEEDDFDLDKLLGAAGRALDAGAESKETASTRSSSQPSTARSSPVLSAHGEEEAGDKDPAQQHREISSALDAERRGDELAGFRCHVPVSAPSAPQIIGTLAQGALSSIASSSAASSPGRDARTPAAELQEQADTADAYDDEFETDASEQEAGPDDAGIAMHQMDPTLAQDEDGYEDDDFDEDDDADGREESGYTLVATQVVQAEATESKALDSPSRHPAIVPRPLSSGMISHQLSLLEEAWMKKDSMQTKIYQVAVQKLALGVITDVFNQCIDEYDERKREEEAIETELKRQAAAAFRQPRTCDLRLAEKKRLKEAERKKMQMERDRKEAEYLEISRTKAAERRKEIKESEAHLAESKERVKKKREKQQKKYENMKQSLLESNRQKVAEIKMQAEQTKLEIQTYIQQHREEEAKMRRWEKRELEQKEAYRQFQQEVAISSLKSFMNRSKEAKAESAAKVKSELRAIKHAEEVFANSLRSNRRYMDKKVAMRQGAKKQRVASFVQTVVPLDDVETGKSYTDSLKLTSALYFSDPQGGSLLPQTRRKVHALSATTLGPKATGKRQMKASTIIAALQDAFLKFRRWRPEGVKSVDLAAKLCQFRLGAPQSRIEGLIKEFGIQYEDTLELDDFVETGVAVFTIIAPDVLIVDAQRRSKSAEPIDVGKKGLEHLERTCMSSLGNNVDISFTKNDNITDDLVLHLSSAVKSQKAREREMMMLAQEALEIKKLRDNRARVPLDDGSSLTAQVVAPSSKGNPLVRGKKTLRAVHQPNVLCTESPAPVDSFMMPSPALEGHLSATAKGAGQVLVDGDSPAAKDTTASAILITGDQGEGTVPPDARQASTAVPIAPEAPEAPAAQVALDVSKMSRVERMRLLKQQQQQTSAAQEGLPQTLSSLSRPGSRGVGCDERPKTSGSSSRPSSRQTPYREGDVIPTQNLEPQPLIQAQGLRSSVLSEANTSSGTLGEVKTESKSAMAPFASVDVSKMSRVERMKYMKEQQQQNAAAQGTPP